MADLKGLHYTVVAGATCAAQEWGYNDDGTIHIYGTCQLPENHESRFHREERDGKLWAEWSGPRVRAPVDIELMIKRLREES